MPTDPGFAGFHPDGFRFFLELHRDNSKAFWEANKHRYLEHVRAPLEALARELEGAFGEWHVYRPYRDLRFTKDKRPYKERASLQFGGRGPGAVGGQYLQIGAEGLFLGVGTYWMDGEQLKAYRRAVASFLAAALDGPYDPDEAAARSAAVPAERLPEVEEQFAALEKGGGIRRLARVALPGATQPDPAIVGPPGPPST